MPTIDLNCDLGEGFGVWTLTDDDALVTSIASANIACGFHAGDPSIMRATCEKAVANDVAIGAQVSYRDLAGFGRRRIDMAPDQLADEVTYQIAALDGFARAAGGRVDYVKPHGALYNTASTDPEQARAVVEGARRFDEELPILALAGSELLAAAGESGVPEAFADRAYTPEGGLVSRREPGAVLHDTDAVVQQCLSIVRHGIAHAVDGSEVAVEARSLCLHGDTSGAVAMTRTVRAALGESGVRVAPFTRPGTRYTDSGPGQ